MNIHYLKSVEPHFKDSQSGKNNEIRNNDREFKVDDLVILMRFDEKVGKCTGEWIARRITHICYYNQKASFVVLSLSGINNNQVYEIIAKQTIKAMLENTTDKTKVKDVVKFKEPEMNDKEKQIMNLIESYGGIDGAHHKQWIIDQVARIIKGFQYEQWVTEMKDGEDGPESYSYDEGIAP